MRAWLLIVAMMMGCRDRGPTSPAGPAPAPAPTPAPPAEPAVDPDEVDAYVPAEFKTGADRWRDTGVYVDGVFQGLLQWAELPLALEPTWLEVKASTPKRAGTTDTGFKIVRERRYRFVDYLAALGIPLAKVREIHVLGPRFSETIVATGAQLASPAGRDFMFRFADVLGGKAIPVTPHRFGNGKSPDKISSVMIYLTKTPPKVVANVGLVLDGEKTTGVPYFGTPHRGGVRVYFDDRLVAYWKRQELPLALATGVAEGEPRWGVLALLASQGVEVARVAEAWVVRDEKWQERFDAAALATLTFTAGMQAKGNVELGPDRVKAQALVLRSKPLPGPRASVRQPGEE